MKLTQTYIGMFTTNNPTTGEPDDADSTPVVTVYKDGAIDTNITMTVSVADPSGDLGVYIITANQTWSAGSFAVDDKVDIYIYATINSIISHAIIDSFILTTVDDIFDEEVDNDGTAISLKGAMKLMLSILTAESSGGGTNTLVFRDIADSKDRLSVDVDSNGNRTGINTRDAT